MTRRDIAGRPSGECFMSRRDIMVNMMSRRDISATLDVTSRHQGENMPSDSVAGQTFMVVGTLRDDTDSAEFAALREDEHKQLETLRSQGRIGAHYVSPARRATFVEIIAADQDQVVETLATLPFARFFDADIYPLAPRDAAERARS
jgi:muconolactone delta-isomerase